jgi:hypothetical protein
MQNYTQVENNVPQTSNLNGLIKNNLVLVDSIPKYININVDSPKGVSSVITLREKKILTSIFGKFVNINFDDLYYLNRGTKIMIQSYIGNCWWVGFINHAGLNMHYNEITLKNAVFIERRHGRIYNATPLTRHISLGIYDIFFIIKD